MKINYLNWSQTHINSNATNLCLFDPEAETHCPFSSSTFRLSSDYRDNDGIATVGTGGQTAVWEDTALHSDAKFEIKPILHCNN